MEIVISFEKSCHNVADDSDLTWNYRNHCNVDVINSIGISIDEFFIRSEIKRTEMKWIDKKSIDDRRRSVFLDFRTFGHVADTSRTVYQDVGMNRYLSRSSSSKLSYIFFFYFDWFRYVRVIEWFHYNTFKYKSSCRIFFFHYLWTSLFGNITSRWWLGALCWTHFSQFAIEILSCACHIRGRHGRISVGARFFFLSSRRHRVYTYERFLIDDSMLSLPSSFHLSRGSDGRSGIFLKKGFLRSSVGFSFLLVLSS